MPKKKTHSINRFLALLFPRFREALMEGDFGRDGPVVKKLHLVMYRFTGPVKYAPKRPLMKRHAHKCPNCRIEFNCRGRACDGAGPNLDPDGDVYCKHCWAGFSD